jgi:hypothetical protein
VANGYLQEKIETTVPGNETNSPTLSTKIMYPVLTEYNVEPGTAPMSRDDELRAQNEQLAVIPEAFAPTWNIAGRMYPDHIGWRLTHMLGPPTTVAGDGIITNPDSTVIPVGAYRHVWTSTSSSWGGTGINPYTMQQVAAYKDQSVFVKVKGCGCDTLSLTTPESGGARLAASGPALYIDDALADPSLTPAYESIATRPFERSGLTVGTWLTGSAAAKEDITLTFSQGLEAVRSLGAASKWPDLLEKAEGVLTVTGALSTRYIDPQDLAALRASTGFAVKVKWLSQTVITGSTYHALWVEGVNAQYTGGGPGTLANARRIGGTFDFALTTAGSGVACTVTLVNSTTAYS